MIKNTFWRGVKATLPLLITFAVVIWIFSVIEAFFGGIFKEMFGPSYYFKGLGSLLGLVFIFCFGILVNLWIIQGIYNYGESLVKRIPVIKNIYNSLEDLMGFFDPTRKGQSGVPVLIETSLGQVIGFVTIDNSEQLPDGLSQPDLIAVYIPLSYQIGGMTVFIHKSQVKEMNMPVDKAMSFVLTAGMTGQKQVG
ncbi:MAG: DUF502 domain-containing protein [Parachlamydiales bacterium]|jgi:uncharacterized membrane protein